MFELQIRKVGGQVRSQDFGGLGMIHNFFILPMIGNLANIFLYGYV
jgi:hypothetical protein